MKATECDVVLQFLLQSFGECFCQAGFLKSLNSSAKSVLSCDDKRESVMRVKFSDVPLILSVNWTERGK
jgi:hypothetical protein